MTKNRRSSKAICTNSRHPPSLTADYNDCLEVLERIVKESSSGDETMEGVVMGIEDHMKSYEIAEFFGIDIQQVYSTTRKLKRRIVGAMKSHECAEHWALLGYSL